MLANARPARAASVAGAVAAFIVAAALAGCSSGSGNGGTGPSTAQLAIAIIEGNGQSATAGQQVATKPAVKVTNGTAPAAGVTVTFAIVAGGGTVTGGTQVTGSDGVARVGGWTLANTAGSNTLTASATGATGSPVTFTATGMAGPAASMSKSAGDGASSAAGVAVASKPTVKVVDAFGNPVSGAGVTFAVASGGGAVTGATPTTAADGTASVGGWTLGQVAGANTLTATASGSGISGSPATFQATGVAGPLASLVKVAGDNQTASISTAVATAPAVKLADQFGNLISSQLVTFAVASGGGSVTGATPSSGANGVATVGGWTLGSAAGANTLTASASTFSVTFTATGAAAFNAQQYAGTYNGTWANTTFGSTGTGSAAVAVNAGVSTATVTVNVTGQVLGTGGASTVKSGGYTNNGATFTGNVSPMGDITATLTADGKITASGVNPPNASIRRWDATGTITSTALNMTFTVTFQDNSTAVGTITMHNP